mmetsp:Transcript_80144/g.212721  ORF Transcript_80144/g.212721 Transcript_80144/m.212721 type:complete len:229 (+) Transcript_80144:41-727(+)
MPGSEEHGPDERSLAVGISVPTTWRVIAARLPWTFSRQRPKATVTRPPQAGRDEAQAIMPVFSQCPSPHNFLSMTSTIKCWWKRSSPGMSWWWARMKAVMSTTGPESHRIVQNSTKLKPPAPRSATLQACFATGSSRCRVHLKPVKHSADAMTRLAQTSTAHAHEETQSDEATALLKTNMPAITAVKAGEGTFPIMWQPAAARPTSRATAPAECTARTGIQMLRSMPQ